ncbi:MAG: hypothetical protein AAF731_07745 [Bacteroidota bacterium]
MFPDHQQGAWYSHLDSHLDYEYEMQESESYTSRYDLEVTTDDGLFYEAKTMFPWFSDRLVAEFDDFKRVTFMDACRIIIELECVSEFPNCAIQEIERRFDTAVETLHGDDINKLAFGPSVQAA